MKRAKWTVCQTETGWAVECKEFEFAAVYPTACEALAKIKDEARILAERGIDTVFVVEWTPTTQVGRWVVKALAGPATSR